MIEAYQKYRPSIYILLIAIVLCSYMVSFAINSIGVGVLCAFFFLDSITNIKAKLQKAKQSRIITLYFLFFILQIVGMLYTDNREFGMKRIITQLPILILPLILLSEELCLKKMNVLLDGFRYWILTVFLFYIAQHVFMDENSLETFVLFIITDRLGISQFYVVFILLIPIITTVNAIRNKKNITLNIILLAFFVFFLFLLGNKTSVFILFILSVLFAFQRNTLFNSIWKKVTIIVVGIILVISAYNMPGIQKRVDVLVKTTDFNIETIITKNSVTHTKNTLEHRLLINYITINEVVDNFPFGVGTGDYQDVLNNNYDAINFKQGICHEFNNHNQYLSEFLKTGILSGTVFLLLMFSLIRQSNFNNQYYIYIVLSFAVACLFESYLDRQHGVVIFAFIIPLFLKYEIENKSV
ncbi:O-antigen ligase family protein [Winogradskyella sp. SM1960]|uniref:O-antigen ligase family protein n=1 Tax=Winogradskyella sp. SM1960 TaxID=2865955 RepID=UPI001CD69F1E|nr:O-antigen ligase family protein [Winogradskyella sp. SM1960]